MKTNPPCFAAAQASSGVLAKAEHAKLLHGSWEMSEATVIKQADQSYLRPLLPHKVHMLSTVTKQVDIAEECCLMKKQEEKSIQRGE